MRQILRNSSISWQFLARSSEKLCFSSLSRHTASSFAFESDQSIDSPDRIPPSGIGPARKRSISISHLQSYSDCASDNLV